MTILLMKRAKGSLSYLFLVIADFDKFKQFNDTYEYPAGDKLLKNFARELEKHFPKDFVIARYGGEEFVVYGKICKDEMLGLVQKFRIVLKNKKWTEIPITFRAGVSEFPEDRDDIEALLKRADDNLYRAKHSGRDRVMG